MDKNQKQQKQNERTWKAINNKVSTLVWKLSHYVEKAVEKNILYSDLHNVPVLAKDIVRQFVECGIIDEHVLKYGSPRSAPISPIRRQIVKTSPELKSGSEQRSKSHSRIQPKEAWGGSFCDDVKIKLTYGMKDSKQIHKEKEKSKAENAYLLKELIHKEKEKSKAENAYLLKELEKLNQYYEQLKRGNEQLIRENEQLIREKKELAYQVECIESEAEKRCQALEARTNRYKAEIHDLRSTHNDDSWKVTCRRYREERNLARYENEDFKKQLEIYRNRVTSLTTDSEYLRNKLTEAQSYIQQRDLEIQALNNKIKGQSECIQEIQKSADEDRKDANDAIVHYKDEEEKYRKATDHANEKISKLKRERSAMLAKLEETKVEKDKEKMLSKLKTEKEEILLMLQKQKSLTEAERQRHKKSEDTLRKELKAIQTELENGKSKTCERDIEDIKREARSNTKLQEENEALKTDVCEMENRLAEQSREHIEIEKRFKQDMEQNKQDRNRALKIADSLKNKITTLDSERKELEAIHRAKVEKMKRQIEDLLSKKDKNAFEGSRFTVDDCHKETLDKKNEELVTLTRKLYEVQEELQFSTDRKCVIEQAYGEMQNKFKNILQQLENSESRLAFSENKRLSDIEKENESLSSKLTTSLNTIERLKQDYNNLEKNHDKETAKYRASLDEIQAQVKNMKIQEAGQKETSRTLDHEKQRMSSKIYSLEDDKIELQDRLQKAEANLKNMQLVKEDNERLKIALSEKGKASDNLEAKNNSQSKRNEDTITNLKDDNEKLRKDINSTRKETERIEREKNVLAQELQTEIDVAKTEHNKLRKEKTDLIALFKENAKTDQDKIIQLEEVNQKLHERYKIEAERVGSEDLSEIFKTENDRLRNERNASRTNLLKIAKENKELTSDIRVITEENEKLKKEKAELVSVFKMTSEKNKDHIDRLERETETLRTRYKIEAERVGSEDLSGEFKTENDRLRNERNASRTDLLKIAKENKELTSDIRVINEENEKLKKEKAELVSVFKMTSEKNKVHIDSLERETETLRTRCSSGDKAKQYNSYELLQLKNDYEICKKQKAQADENLADLQQENTELENTLKELESQNQHCMKCDEYERKLNKLKKDYQELQVRYNMAKNKLKELSSEVEDGKQETANVTKILEKVVKEKNNLESQLRERESSRKDSGEVISLQRRINILQSENAELNQRCQHKNKVQQDADDDKRSLHTRISQLESNITELKQDKETLNSRVEVLREEKSELEERLRRRSPQVVLDPRNCQNCWKYRNDISDLKREVNDLRDRLSEAAGNRLRDNNPNIADLSDMNRPTSLAEKFSSLYTDEYTDAMEVIEDDMDEKAVVDIMLQWLQSCYDWCEKLAKEQRNLLTTESVGFMQKYCGKHMDLALSDKSYIFVKEFQKKIAPDTISPVGNICNEKSVKEKRLSSDSRIIKYLKKCSDLCWMMQIADPPMYLHFEIQQGQNLDKNYYNVFTKSGSTIDFLVWPVLKLHRNGPMLAKGVAQGK